MKYRDSGFKSMWTGIFNLRDEFSNGLWQTFNALRADISGLKQPRFMLNMKTHTVTNQFVFWSSNGGKCVKDISRQSQQDVATFMGSWALRLNSNVERTNCISRSFHPLPRQLSITGFRGLDWWKPYICSLVSIFIFTFLLGPGLWVGPRLSEHSFYTCSN